MRVRPSRPGLIVGYPRRPGAPLAQGGEEVPEVSYWMRRLRRGDVVRVEDAPVTNRPAPDGPAPDPQASSSRRKKRTRRSEE